MKKIQVLDKKTAELLAAGEVVERPSSVIKELIENALDAKSTAITAEIERGGIVFIRVTDNGVGMAREDVPTAFLRHATSKIRNEEDLDGILTLGFRGEALAAICAVSRTEVLTGNGIDIGTHYVIEGGEEVELSDSGCPKGTTMIVRDIFYNTPARMKFLKKDVTEGNAVASVVEKLALSHPEVAFKFIRDGKTIFSTPGDGKLSSAVYSVLGREFALAQLPVNGSSGGVTVSGFTCKPANCRANRTSQYFFINGRCFRSDTVTAALEQAYKNSAMIGRFPSCVLNIEMDPSMVDVNVHPAKTEVRFADKKAVFDGVYYAVKAAVTEHDDRPAMDLGARNAVKAAFIANQFPETVAVQQPIPTPSAAKERPITPPKNEQTEDTILLRDSGFNTFNLEKKIKAYMEKKNEETSVQPSLDVDYAADPYPVENKGADTVPQTENKIPVIQEYEPSITYIGEVFKTYILAEMDGDLYFIDKHAAHERIIYNKLKNEAKNSIQLLLPPVAVSLSTDDYDVIINNMDILEESGFTVEDFGNSVIVSAVPSIVVGMDISALLEEIARNLSDKRSTLTDKVDRIYETAACRTAVKAGNINGAAELEAFAKKILSNKDIMYCPHGRPVAIKLTKSTIEKQFGRLG